MSDQKNIQKPTVKTAVADCIPVVCFAASMVLIFLFYPSALFLVGTVLCVLAGLGKVAWKLILARTHRNVSFLDMEKVVEGRADSTDYTEVCIQGGNHAGFGSYGPQAGDGTATISKEEQWEQTAEAVEDWIR